MISDRDLRQTDLFGNDRLSRIAVRNSRVIRHLGKQWNGKQLQRDLEARGIYIRSTSWAGLAEEAGAAYKDIDEVIEAAELAGISKPVARFTPIGNVKG